MARPNITNGAFALFLLGLTAGIASAQDHPGVESYNHVCGFCHGPEGRGDPAPPLVPLAYEVDYILAIVREGYGEMPPISTRELSDEQVRRVVEYLEILTRDISSRFDRDLANGPGVVRAVVEKRAGLIEGDKR